jgi:OmpA-OmpF porin, OOP family
MKRIIITASLLGGMLYQAKAQEFTIGINGAQAGTRYQLPDAHIQLQPSFGGELGLQFRLNNHFKILTGLEFFKYQTKATLADNKVYAHNLIDDMGSSFEYRVVTSSYSETQSFTALRVPLMLQLTAGSLQKTQWYFNAGGKFMLPAKIAVKATASKIVTTGYYPDVNAEVHDLPQHGFGIVNNWQGNGSYSTKSGWLLTAGTGFSFKLTPSGAKRLYAGVYADYSPGNLQRNTAALPLVTYNSQNAANVQANGTMGMDAVKNLQLMNIGIQLKLGFGNKQKVKKPLPPPQAPAQAAPLAKQVLQESPVSDSIKKKTITTEERTLIEQPVSFGKKNNVDLNIESKQFLDTVASILNKYPSVHIVIKGHACDLGTPEINQRRSLERATALAGYLASQGVNKSRMQTVSMAASEPMVPNNSEENREKNRRVTIVVSE